MGRTPLPADYETQREGIEAGAYYILPNEVESLSARLALLGVTQEELGTLLNEAMTQSSETFHDNAPADAINSASHIVTSEANTIIRVLHYAARIPYPETTDQMRIGNIVSVVYEDDDVPERVLLTGYTRKVDTSAINTEDEISVVSAGSPMGLALLDAHVGEQVGYEVNERNFKLGVVAIDSIYTIS